jgi:outer membrane lipoprotein SlyB
VAGRPISTMIMPHDSAGMTSYQAHISNGGDLLPRSVEFFLPALAPVLVLVLAGCAPDYSPDTYASNAVQQANKVEPAVVVGFRQVEISASGTVGAVSGGAAGGILGAQADGSGITTALGTVGGGLVGSILGTGIEHATADTTGWEYIVRKPNGDLLSVTQREKTPIPLGQKVLVITGNQARIIPDYSMPPPEKPPEKAAEKKPPEAKPAETAPAPPDAAPAATPAATGSPTPLTPPAPASETAVPEAAPAPADTTTAPPSEPKDAAPPADAPPPTPSDDPVDVAKPPS